MGVFLVMCLNLPRHFGSCFPTQGPNHAPIVDDGIQNMECRGMSGNTLPSVGSRLQHRRCPPHAQRPAAGPSMWLTNHELVPVSCGSLSTNGPHLQICVANSASVFIYQMM